MLAGHKWYFNRDRATWSTCSVYLTFLLCLFIAAYVNCWIKIYLFIYLFIY